MLATANRGKQRELGPLLAPLGFTLRLASEWGLPSAPENGDSFERNALLKARHASRATGLPALADDSGLEVDALCGRPGIYSARYAGACASDADNNAKLLAELAGVPLERRGACYRCVLVIVRHGEDRQPLIARGAWRGHIAIAPAGNAGFGYDPLFVPEEQRRSVAELPAALKQQCSHRARAAAALITLLQSGAGLSGDESAPPPVSAAGEP